MLYTLPYDILVGVALLAVLGFTLLALVAVRRRF